MNLRGGPLTSGSEDRSRYLRRPVDDRIDRALAAGLTVLVGARRGAGATSLLYRLEADHDDAILINAAAAETAWEVLQAIAARAGIPRQLAADFAASFRRVDPLEVPRALRELRDALLQADRHLLVLLDGPVSPSVSTELFGRMRDAVYSLPMTWVVIGQDERLTQYLTPPADVFFDVVERLDDLDPTGVEALLSLRGADALGRRSVERIAQAQDGTPRHTLALARAALVADETDDDLAAYARATSQLSQGASMMLAELQGRGPIAATDPGLRRRLGKSSRQLRRDLDELRDADLVQVVPGGTGAPGRPPTFFALTPLGAYTQGEIIASSPGEAP